MFVGDPKILVALLCWGVSPRCRAAHHRMERRRAAWLSAIAFVIVLLNLHRSGIS
jgi:hypothetical protein